MKIESMRQNRAKLTALRDVLPRLAEQLHIDPSRSRNGINLVEWTRLVERKLLPQLADDFPLIVTLAGAADTGKSTIFNTLLDDAISPVSPEAGLTKRVIAAIHPDWLAEPTFLPQLFQPLGAIPEPMQDRAQATRRGAPLYIVTTRFPKNIVILDVPDFNAGDLIEYANRNTAKAVFDVSDLIIYVITMQTYCDRNMVQFMKSVLVDVGWRPFLVVYTNLTQCEISTSAELCHQAVSLLVEGDAACRVLGMYDSTKPDRRSELVELRPLPGSAPFRSTLAGIAVQEVRTQRIMAASQAALAWAEQLYRELRSAQDELWLYEQALRLTVEGTIQTSAAQVILQVALWRIAEHFKQSRGSVVKGLNRMGEVLGWPVAKIGQLVQGAYRWLLRREAVTEVLNQEVVQLGEQLADRAVQLRNQCLRAELEVELAPPPGAPAKAPPPHPALPALRERVARVRQASADAHSERPWLHETPPVRLGVRQPTVLRAACDELAAKDWAGVSEEILRQICEEILRPPQRGSGSAVDPIDAVLRRAALKLRAGLTRTQRAKEVGLAVLHIIPPAVAITYVLATGGLDPSAPLLLAKLKGLFGLNDLWGLLGMPSAEALNQLLDAQTRSEVQDALDQWWLSRRRMLGALLEQQVTAGLLAEISRLQAATQADMARAAAIFPGAAP